MQIEIPTVPLGIVTLFAFFGPYAVAALNGLLAFVTKPWQKKLVGIVVSIALAAVAIVIYLALGGSLPAGGWAAVAIWSIVILAAAYALVWKNPAARVEASVEKSLAPPAKSTSRSKPRK